MNWPEAHACQQHKACQARHAIPRSGERSLDAAREISASAVGIFLREKLLARLGNLPPACKAWSISCEKVRPTDDFVATPGLDREPLGLDRREEESRRLRLRTGSPSEWEAVGDEAPWPPRGELRRLVSLTLSG